MSIDPNSNDEVYEINTLDDSLETVIKLTKEKVPEQPVTGEKASETTERIVETKDQPFTSISTTEDRVLVPDVISQTMADDYMREEELEEEDSDAETISSTSTANYDREEAEDLLNKISSCHTALATHYNKMNKIVPHMTKMQLAQYLGKVHIMNIVKTEGIVSKTYTSEPDTSEIKFVVRGETHEEKLQELVDTVPAHQLMLAIAIGDIHLNELLYDQASQKYQISKSRIQRAISGRTEHKKGGKQYQQEENVRLNRGPPHLLKRGKMMTRMMRRKRLHQFQHSLNNPRNRIPSQTSSMTMMTSSRRSTLMCKTGGMNRSTNQD